MKNFRRSNQLKLGGIGSRISRSADQFSGPVEVPIMGGADFGDDSGAMRNDRYSGDQVLLAGIRSKPV